VNAWWGHLAALAAGLLLTGAFAPFEFWPAAPLSLLILLLVCRSCNIRLAALRGWLFGFGLFGSGASWVWVSIHVYGNASIALATALTALFCGGLALLPAATLWAWARWVRDRPLGISLGFPVAWVLGEWVRSWLLSGFPWLLIGTSQLDSPLRGWLPILGPYAGSLIVASTASALLVSRKSNPWRPGLSQLAVLVAWLIGLPLAHLNWVEPQGAPLDIALVQGNTPQELKWVRGRREEIIRSYIDLSASHWDADLVVWPEAAIPPIHEQIAADLDALDGVATRHRAGFITGIPTLEEDASGDRIIHNSLISRGAATGSYHKKKLVPFGEYVPLEGLLRGLIDFFNLPRSYMSPGPDRQRPLSLGALQIAPFICYEIAYPDAVAGNLGDASLLLTVSNDTWFGASIGPLQHLQLARSRALENGRPVIRATNNGVSALIDHQGTIRAHGGQFTQEVITGQLQPTTGHTPYTIWRSWPVLGFCALFLACSRVYARQKARYSHGDKSGR